MGPIEGGHKILQNVTFYLCRSRQDKQWCDNKTRPCWIHKTQRVAQFNTILQYVQTTKKNLAIGNNIWLADDTKLKSCTLYYKVQLFNFVIRGMLLLENQSEQASAMHRRTLRQLCTTLHSEYVPGKSMCFKPGTLPVVRTGSVYCRHPICWIFSIFRIYLALLCHYYENSATVTRAYRQWCWVDVMCTDACEVVWGVSSVRVDASDSYQHERLAEDSHSWDHVWVRTYATWRPPSQHSRQLYTRSVVDGYVAC